MKKLLAVLLLVAGCRTTSVEEASHCLRNYGIDPATVTFTNPRQYLCSNVITREYLPRLSIGFEYVVNGVVNYGCVQVVEDSTPKYCIVATAYVLKPIIEEK